STGIRTDDSAGSAPGELMNTRAVLSQTVASPVNTKRPATSRSFAASCLREEVSMAEQPAPENEYLYTRTNTRATMASPSRGDVPLHTEAAGAAPPDAFGPFRVLHQVGAGALGPVFRAFDPGRNRLVAIKLFRLD